MKHFLALQNIVALQRRLDDEGDPKQRAIIERVLADEEAVLLLTPHKISGKTPFLSPSPGICGDPAPRLVPRFART